MESVLTPRRQSTVAPDHYDRGAASVEYAILASLIAAVFAATAFLLGPKVLAALQTVVNAL